MITPFAYLWRTERMRRSFACVLLMATVGANILAQESTSHAIGEDAVSKRRLPTGRSISPVGESLPIYGRPVDLAVGKYLFVKDWKSLRVVDPVSMELLDTVPLPGNASLYGIKVTSKGDVLVTNASDQLYRFRESERGKFALVNSVEFPADSFPIGLCVTENEDQALVCLSKKNKLAVVELAAMRMTQTIDVGVAPFDVATIHDRKVVVSNLGGRHPKADELTAPSAGTETVVDRRGVASSGTMSVVDLDRLGVVQTLEVGRHPSILLSSQGSVWLCNTNDDTVQRLDSEFEVTAEITTKPDAKLLFGSMPNGLAITSDHQLLMVALAGNNAIAVYDNGDANLPMLGLVPTAWFPSAVACNDEYLFIACTKGYGARSLRREEAKGWNSHDHRGTIQRVALKDIRDADTLRKWTQIANQNSRVSQALRAANPPMQTSAAGVAAKPVPTRLGEPSCFQHVIYVIKENRTFDQVFGDIEEARSDAGLCIFPEEVTPNHHALARRFGVLDNYYCNGVLSADGHSWATEGNVTPYLERAFGGFARSYTFGDDPITYSSSGFLWDHVLAAGLSFRNYGEMDYAQPPDDMGYQEIWQAYERKQPLKFKQTIGIDKLARYSCREYPGWNMKIPDVLRMDRFLAEFREFEETGQLPHLSLVYLPQDHLGGGVTSRAHMADNDLALGRLVEAVSKSKFWKNTVIFVNEDDPQNGYDHIDGHRSICLVVSAYSQPGVNHDFFNQTSVLRTILHIFGLPPMNQQDASAPLMASCFRAGEPNLKPYQALPANFPLNEQSQPKAEQSGLEKNWRMRLATVPIERTGMKTPEDEDNLNRFVWHEMKGWTTPYPVEWAGAHGKGLAALRLSPDPDRERDD